MAFINCSRVSIAFGDRDILLGVNLSLAAGSRAALAGANGAGKSTLMKIIAGLIDADRGDFSRAKGCRVSYLPQSGIVHRGRTLYEEAESAFADIHSLIEKKEEAARALENSSADSGRTAVLLEEYQRLEEAVEASGYYRREAHIYQVLAGLKFAEADQSRDVGEFSGGWQMRIALAKILLAKADIMLLDEPTNYLDIEARAWLLAYLQSFSGGCLIVSHDRFFLDSTVREVYELFQGNLRRYAGNYSDYEKTRAVELAGLVKRYEEQQEEIEKTEALIRRFRYKASKAAFAQDLIKRLERMERIEIPENLKRIHITFPSPPHSSRVAFTLEGVGKSYGALRVLAGVDLALEAGERLLVAGPNGAGKSTLLRIIAGADTAFEGSLSYGAKIAAGYFSQDAAENIRGSTTVEEYIEAAAPTHLVPKVRAILGAFLFRGDDVYKPLSVLSGGEKSRLALLKMLLEPKNLLILDEPTNHLDLQSKDILLKCLEDFAGTIVFVSHDRAFMEALSTKTLELSVGSSSGTHRHRLFYGNYAYYLERVASEAAGGNDKANETTLKAKKAAATNEQLTALGEHKKQREAQIRRLVRREDELLRVMEKIEGEINRLRQELERPEVYSSREAAQAAVAAIEAAAAALDAKGLEWETLERELETARKERNSP